MDTYLFKLISKLKNFDYELEGGIEDWKQRVEEQKIKEEKKKAKAK